MTAFGSVPIGLKDVLTCQNLLFIDGMVEFGITSAILQLAVGSTSLLDPRRKG